MNTSAATSSAAGSLSETAQVLIAILPLASVMILGILIFVYMMWDHQKNILIINKGGTPRPRNIDDKLLLLGIVSIFIGAGLIIFSAIYSGFTPSLLGGIIPFSAGAGIITYFWVKGKKTP
jgi:hypothetical protein